MSVSEAVKLLSELTPLLIAIITIITNVKFISYKIDVLEKKVEKHNNVVEDVAVVKRDLKTAFNHIDDIKTDINRIEDRLNSSKK